MSGEFITTFEGHTAPVTAFAFSADGGRVATASADRTVRIWEFRPTTETRLRGHVGDVRFAAFGRSDEVTVTASFDPGWTISRPQLDGFIRVWDTQSGRPVAELEGIGEGVLGSPTLKGLAFEPTPGRIIAQYDLVGERSHPILRLIDAGDGRIRAEKDGHFLLGRCGNAGTFLTEKDNTIHAWDLRDGTIRFTIRGEMPVRGVASFPGDRLATIVDDRGDRDFYDLQLWDARTGRAIARVEKIWKKSRSETDGTVYPVSWHVDLMGSPDGRTLVILGGDADVSLILDLTTAQITGRFRIPSFKVEGGAVRGGAIDEATFSPDGRYLITVGNATSVWDGASGRRLGMFEGVFLDWHPRSSQLVTLSEGQAMVWDLAAGGARRDDPQRQRSDYRRAIRLQRDPPGDRDVRRVGGTLGRGDRDVVDQARPPRIGGVIDRDCPLKPFSAGGFDARGCADLADGPSAHPRRWAPGLDPGLHRLRAHHRRARGRPAAQAVGRAPGRHHAAV